MEWFDNDFFKALEMVGLVQADKDLRKNDEWTDKRRTACERLEKERDYWKGLFEKEYEANKMLTNTVNKLTDYLDKLSTLSTHLSTSPTTGRGFYLLCMIENECAWM